MNLPLFWLVIALAFIFSLTNGFTWSATAVFPGELYPVPLEVNVRAKPESSPNHSADLPTAENLTRDPVM